MFSFIVLIYNEEKVLYYCLESIKYQIIHHGEKRSFQLILADDASADASCAEADQWVEKNKNLFQNIVKLYAEKNRGTCINLCSALQHMIGEEFYIIAGDDLLAVGNLFAKYQLLETYDVIGNGVLKFRRDTILTKNMGYLNVVLQKLYSEHYLKSAVKYGCPILNGAIIRKSLLTQSVMERMEQFVLLEDRARYYQIFMENDKIAYYYDDAPTLLYRQTENSVSSSKGAHKSVLDTDIEGLYDIAYRETASIKEKIFLLIQQWMIRFRRKRGLMRVLQYATPYYIKLSIIIILNFRKLVKYEKELILKYGQENEEYLRGLMNRMEEVNGNQKN